MEKKSVIAPGGKKIGSSVATINRLTGEPIKGSV